jgi:3-oxoacyl-[acyl-carrier-protein] synthase-3
MKILAEKKDRETFTKTIATFTGGSGAVAVILTDGSFQSEPKAKLIGAVARNSSQHHDLCRWGLVEHETLGLRQFMATDAVAVLKHGVALGVETWRAFLAELNWNPQDVDRVISHQVGASHRRAILGALEIPQEIDYASFPYLGNMGTVSLPLTAALAHDEGFLQAGHRVGFLGIGSGLNCLMMGIEW